MWFICGLGDVTTVAACVSPVFWFGGFLLGSLPGSVALLGAGRVCRSAALVGAGSICGGVDRLVIVVNVFDRCCTYSSVRERS